MIKKLLIIFIFVFSANLYAESLKSFNLHYNVKKNNIKFAETNNKLFQIDDEWIFEINSTSAGLLLFLNDDRSEKSTFSYKDNKIKTKSYKYYKILSKSYKKYDTKFDWENIKAKTVKDFGDESKNEIEHELSGPVYDRLSVQIDFREKMKLGYRAMEYAVIDKGRFRYYQFLPIDKQKIETIFGLTETIVIKKMISDSKRNTLTWYAVNHDFVPVKIEQFRGNKLKFTVILNSIEN